MKQRFEYTGSWWEPSKPDKRLAGTLKHCPEEGTILEVMGSFHPQGARKRPPLDVVHGMTGEAAYVSLHRCSENSSSRDYRGQYRTIYRADTAILGDHIGPAKPIAFPSVMVRYSSLIPWAHSPLVDESDFHQPGPIEKVSVYPDKAISLGQHRDCLLSLSYGPAWEMTGRGLTLAVKPYAYVTFTFEGPREFKVYMELISVFRDFLTFATGMPTAVLDMSAPPVRFTDIGHAHDHKIYSRAFCGPVRSVEYAPSLFELSDVQPNVEAVVAAWFAAAEKLQPVFDQYLAGRYNPEMQPESQFLAIVRAVEAYHRRTRDNRELPDAEHQARIKAVLAGAPEQHRAWLEDALAYSNEPRLRRRLKTLFDEHIGSLSHFKLRRREFVRAACDTRNYLTHYDQSLEGKTPKGLDLWMLIYSLQLLLDVCLLKDLNVPDETVIKLARGKHMLLS